MKKKTIEKIPFLKLRKVSRKKDAKYVGVTEIKTIDGEKHLFLEVYKNSREMRNIPLVRIVLTKKDFGNYFPESGEWSRKKIETGYYSDGLVWGTQEDKRDPWSDEQKKNILQDEEDLNRIKDFCKTKIWNEKQWWEYIYKREDEITYTERQKAENRRYERRQKALSDRIENTPELPEEKILKRAETQYFHNLHYLYYKKRGSRATVACSKCGGVTDAKWKRGESYESQFEHVIEEPREGQYGKCPMCGARGKYKCQGKTKGKHGKTIHLFLGQKYKETGMVIRYIEVSKQYNLQLIAGDKGEEMHNASEEISEVEVARAYFEPGKKTQIDYQKHNWYDGKDFWDDCNFYGNKNITIDEAPIMWETYEEMKGTIFQYSGLEEYAREVGKTNPIKYLGVYKETPQIEMLTKLGLIRTVEHIVGYGYEIVEDIYARRPDDFLGIRKERVKQLIEKRGDINLLKAMKIERSMQQVWTDEQVEHVAETGLKAAQIEQVTRYMSIQKLLNRIEKYAGCEYGTECSRAVGMIRETARTYVDYLNMRESLGYNMNNSIYQQPRSLRAAHDKMVMESNKEEIDKRLQEVKDKYQNIRKNYRTLRNKYFFEDDEYIIRPARSAEEIVIEGRILHHCVGGDNYLKKHNDGKSYILVLRHKEEAETPYITVEIDAVEKKIIQWYGSHDNKPDEENMQKWIDEYIERLKNGTLEHTQEMKVAIA